MPRRGEITPRAARAGPAPQQPARAAGDQQGDAGRQEVDRREDHLRGARDPGPQDRQGPDRGARAVDQGADARARGALAPRRRRDLPGAGRGSGAPRPHARRALAGRVRPPPPREVDGRAARERADRRRRSSRATPTSARTTSTAWRRPTRPSPTTAGSRAQPLGRLRGPPSLRAVARSAASASAGPEPPSASATPASSSQKPAAGSASPSSRPPTGEPDEVASGRSPISAIASAIAPARRTLHAGSGWPAIPREHDAPPTAATADHDRARRRAGLRPSRTAPGAFRTTPLEARRSRTGRGTREYEQQRAEQSSDGRARSRERDARPPRRRTRPRASGRTRSEAAGSPLRQALGGRFSALMLCYPSLGLEERSVASAG